MTSLSLCRNFSCGILIAGIAAALLTAGQTSKGLELVISLDKQQYAAGQSILVLLTLRNDSEQTYVRNERMVAHEFPIEVLTSAGRMVALTEHEANVRLGPKTDIFSAEVTLAPRSAATVKENITKTYKLNEVGQYTAQASTTVADSRGRQVTIRSSKIYLRIVQSSGEQ